MEMDWTHSPINATGFLEKNLLDWNPKDTHKQGRNQNYLHEGQVRKKTKWCEINEVKRPAIHRKRFIDVQRFRGSDRN